MGEGEEEGKERGRKRYILLHDYKNPGEGTRSYITPMNVHTRVDSATYDSTQRVPSSVIEPVMETVETFSSKKLCCTEVEVPIMYKITFNAQTHACPCIGILAETPVHINRWTCSCTHTQTYGSNSWMTLSNLITANNLVEKATE